MKDGGDSARETQPEEAEQAPPHPHLVELNEAWKLKLASDPTILPKGKSQARKEKVTLAEINHETTDAGGIEQQSINFSEATTGAGFQQTAYFALRLDTVDDSYINSDTRREDDCLPFHQVDAEDITLLERYDSCQVNPQAYDRYERFDDIGGQDTQPNFTSGENAGNPTTSIPSPPPQVEPQRAEEIQDQHPEAKPLEGSNANREMEHELNRQGQVKRKTRKQPEAVMDYEQTTIPVHIYQSWLHDASDIVSRRGQKRKRRRDILSTVKISNLMELPPTVLIDDLCQNGDIYYPQPLLQLWKRSTQPPHDSPSVRTSQPLPPEPSSSSPPEKVNDQDFMGYNFEEAGFVKNFEEAGFVKNFEEVVGSQEKDASFEKQRTEVVNDEVPTKALLKEFTANLSKGGAGIPGTNLVTPTNSGDKLRVPSSGSGLDIPNARANKKRPYSSSRGSSGSSLETVFEESSFPDPNFKLSRLTENDPSVDQELLVETGPTQTQQKSVSNPVDKMTDSIRMQMKQHFETPGATQVESLDSLAAGMNKKGAALLFYQICVLATLDDLKVEQKVSYGEILISKGANM
ncbi:hypothetical protein Tsubulata_021761 [Turnera subulata]|uniref:Rad21/Rec8-like protein C-terminal eukaryotic domain-containing protein n=1 Tax=Turnera subulata TaxID=218843 RepID=A0A9Q0FCN9_9ROSI|nr:hypothetical protein Tsubulata_021761 [Turnera subulata]